MLSHVANYRPIYRWRKRKLRQVAKYFCPTRRVLGAEASVAESAEKLLVAMLAQADACNRRQNPEVASPLPTNLSRSRFMFTAEGSGGRKVGHLTEAFHAACKSGR
ncbi:hypothetical protein [Mesorhizobium sp.]|uniref:hypothetical protein n=1 Tax=Mesorhizobium sp. TaxID=1871066 RepID=UPI0011F71B9F|nr:hypothetical protein [Mesorhizobium sp.]TIL46248.1 MAG: hypothetical protein E5Y86_07875 [Mesorhizobium sp.]TIM43024.1 MAG: hypothetical protein E5Y56_18970 [Mesorhizobium sp.]